MPSPHQRTAARYAVALLAVAVALLLKWGLDPLIGRASPYLLSISAVMVAAWYGGLRPGLAATALSAAGIGLMPMSTDRPLSTAAERAVHLALLGAEGVLISVLAEELHAARRRAERAAAGTLDRERRLRTLLEAAPIGITFSRDGITEYANPAYLRMFGFDDERELRGRPFVDRIAPADRPALAERNRRRERGEPEPASYEATGLHKDGTTFPFRVEAARIDLPEGPASLAFLVDESARREAERGRARGRPARPDDPRQHQRRLLRRRSRLAVHLRQPPLPRHGGPVRRRADRQGPLGGLPPPARLDDRGQPPPHGRRGAAGPLRLPQHAERALVEGSVYPSEEGLSVYFRDDNDRRQAEEALRFLAEAGVALASSLDVEVTLARIAELAVPRVADWCVVRLADEDGRLRPLASAHADPDKAALTEEFYRRYPPDPESPHGPDHVFRTGVADLTPEVPEDRIRAAARDAEHLRMMRELGLQSYLCVPLEARGRRFGTISLVSAGSGRRFGPADLEVAQDLARRAALAIDNSRLYGDAREAIRRRDEARALADALLAAAPIGVAFLDPQLRYVRVNAVMAALNGRPAEDHSGRTLAEVVGAVEAARFEPHLRRVLATGEPLVGWEFPGRAPGDPAREGHWSATYYPAFGPDGDVLGIGVMLADVTERRRAELELRRSEALFRGLAESGLFGVTFGRLDGDGPIDYANDYFLRMVGRDRDELEAGRLRWADLVPPDQADLDARKVAELCDRGAIEPYERDFLRPDGARVTALVGAARLPAGPDRAETALAFVLDLTERKRAERGLERYRLLSRYARDIVLFIRPDGRIAEANESAVAAYGYDRQTLLSLRIFDLRESDAPEVAEQMVWAEAGLTFETVHRRRDGTAFPVEVSSRRRDRRRAPAAEHHPRHHRAQAGRGGPPPE